MTTLIVAAKATTSNVLNISQNPIGARQNVTLTASVSGSAPTGTVSFLNGTTVIGTATISSGKASTSVTFTAVGSVTLTASYAGDSANLASVSAAIVSVVKAFAATGTTLTVTPNPIGAGQVAKLTATITGTSPTGTVTFKNGTVNVGTATINAGTATLSIPLSVVGTQNLSATYSGTAGNASSTSAVVPLTVNTVSVTSTALAVSQNTPHVGQTVTLTATVAGGTPTVNQPVTLIATVGAGQAPSGTVTFSEGNVVIGRAALAGNQASYPTTFATTGIHELKAYYSGDRYNYGNLSVFNLNVTAIVAPPPPTWLLQPGQSLSRGQSLTSSNARYTLVMQNDGNLVLYRNTGGVVFATNAPGDSAVMQSDGNFVVYSGSMPTWSTLTGGNPNAYLVVQDDGNLVIYSAAGIPLWNIGADPYP